MHSILLLYNGTTISLRFLLEENWRKHILQKLIVILKLLVLLLLIISVYIHSSVWHSEEIIIWEASWSIDDEIRNWRVIIRRGGSREQCGTATGRDRVVVLTFICCDYDSWILVRSFNSLLHVALLRRASVVTPVLVIDIYSFSIWFIMSVRKWN